MSGYQALVSARFRALLQYRSAAIAGLTTQIFFGLTFVMVFEAFFRSSTALQPMTLGETTTYIWLGQAFFVLIPWNVDNDLRAMIRSGGVSYELLRPLDLYAAWFTRAIAMRTAPTLLRSIPLVTLAALFLGMQAPDSLASGIAFAITNILTISLMWTISGDGITGFAPALIMTLSGMIVPIPFFPDWAQSIIRVLPFSGLVDTPYRLYLGHLPASDLPILFAHQLIWTGVFVLLGRWMLSRALKRMTVQGG